MVTMFWLLTLVFILLNTTTVQCGDDDTCSKNGDCPDTDSNLLVVAFDFGTTYSGYAFAFRDGKPRGAHFSPISSQGDQNFDVKTSTCVLLTPQKEFHSFGFEAEDHYLKLTQEDIHHGWLFFRRFKMLLHDNENLTKETTIKDINGVSMPAMTIFAMSIRYMKDHLMRRLDREEPWVKEKDIEYVLTVPAIWHDDAKTFMREAAVEALNIESGARGDMFICLKPTFLGCKAGIKSSLLKLALEPEAASIWCQTILDEARTLLHKVGTQYMVIDLGGGTGDISVHEKLIDGKLKEIHRPSGGSFGGTIVDENFLQWLYRLFGQTTIEQFKKEDMESYINLLRDFERKKRGIRPDVYNQITLDHMYSLRTLYEQIEHMSLQDKVASLGLSKKLSVVSVVKLRVDASIVKEWFESPIKRMISHVKSILVKPHLKNVKTIMLVGGFGGSEMVYEALQNQFAKSHKIIRPYQASLSVLYGAVQFGHIPDKIRYRIMKSTYGIGVRAEFDESKHPVSKMIMVKNRKMVDHIFDIFVSKDDTIELGKEILQNFVPTVPDQSSVPIYKSTKHEPVYVTEKGCTEIGELVIPHPEGTTLEDKKFSVTFVFGDTELYVKVKLKKTGTEFTKYI